MAVHVPSVEDFAAPDRPAVRSMLDEMVEAAASPLARWPLTYWPGAAVVTELVDCRLTLVRNVVLEVTCLSDAPALELRAGDRAHLYDATSWTREQYHVTADAVAEGERRTCVLHGVGIGSGLWKRFLILPGLAR